MSFKQTISVTVISYIVIIGMLYFIACSDNCQSQGNGYCHSPSDYSCCPYFNKEGECTEEKCTDCSTECEVGKIYDTSILKCVCQGNWGGDNCTGKKLNSCSGNNILINRMPITMFQWRYTKYRYLHRMYMS